MFKSWKFNFFTHFKTIFETLNLRWRAFFENKLLNQYILFEYSMLAFTLVIRNCLLRDHLQIINPGLMDLAVLVKRLNTSQQTSKVFIYDRLKIWILHMCNYKTIRWSLLINTNESDINICIDLKSIYRFVFSNKVQDQVIQKKSAYKRHICHPQKYRLTNPFAFTRRFWNLRLLRNKETKAIIYSKMWLIHKKSKTC